MTTPKTGSRTVGGRDVEQLVEQAAASHHALTEATRRRDLDLTLANAAGASMYLLHQRTGLSQAGVAKIIRRPRGD